MPAKNLEEEIRHRVIGSLHAGHLHPGDRLPSVRQLGRELDVDPRAALRAYRALEEEGLVEIRTRSGVFLAEQRQVAPEMAWETSEWVASDVLTEAWRRRIRIPDLPDFLRRCTTAVQLRCACVDAVEDVRVSICHEIEEDFGLEAEAVALTTTAGEEVSVPDRVLAKVDLMVCTTFHAPAMRPVADRLGKPLVVVSVNPLALEQMERSRRAERLRFVVVDRAFGPRLRAAFGEDIEVLTLDDVGSGGPPEGALYSRAAALRSGDPEAERLVPTVPVLSPETVEDLAHWIVRLNLEKGEG